MRKNNAINRITTSATRQRPLGRWKLLITARERHFQQLGLVNERSRLFSRFYRNRLGSTSGFFLKEKEKNNSPCVYFVDKTKITKRSKHGKASRDRRSRHLSYLSKFFVASPSRDPLWFFSLSPSLSLLLVRVSPSTATRATSFSCCCCCPRSNMASPICACPKNLYSYFQANSFIDL